MNSGPQGATGIIPAALLVATATAIAFRAVLLGYSHWSGYLLDALVVLLMCVGASLFARTLGEARRTFERQRRGLQERSAELEQFAGRLAHDIRGAISIAHASSELIVRCAEDARIKELAHRGLRGLGRANAIIGGLLDFARSGAHPDPGARTNVRLATADLVNGLRPEAERAGVELLAPESPALFAACSEGVYLSLLGNLSRNALKYIGDAPKKRVEIRVRRDGSMVRVEVADTGPGIAREHLCTLFDPYFRIAGARPEGIGLGLATVKKLAESHGGRAGVVTALGAGSTFWFELPAAGEATDDVAETLRA